MYGAVLMQCLADLLSKISDLRLGDLLEGSLECGQSEIHGGVFGWEVRA